MRKSDHDPNHVQAFCRITSGDSKMSSGSDSWLGEYDACSRLGQDLMEKVTERNKNSRTSTTYTKLSAQIRVSMKQFSNELNRLRQNLIRASSSYHITQREVDRRQIMVDNLTTKEKQLDNAFLNEGDDSRYNLMVHGSDTFRRSDPWGTQDEPEEYRDMSNQDVRQTQQQIIAEQDKGLESLSHVIGRQKQMALDIGDEVDAHNEILDDINEHVDRTKDRLLKETRHITIVDRKSATCCYWVMIVILFLAIIVVGVIPYNGKA